MSALRRLLCSCLLVAPAVALLSGETALAARPGHRILNPCAVLRLSDARALLGRTARKASSQKMGLFSSCSYSTPKPYAFVQVLVATTSSISRAEHGKTAGTVFQETFTGSPGNAITLKGLGNRAFFDKGIGELWVLKGDVVFEVNGTFSQRTVLAQDEKAARRVLSHL